MLSFAAESTVGRLFGARPGTAYLVRPDNRVAARWREATPQQVDEALNTALCTARSEELQ